jgi:hypothetical protein
MKPFSIWWTIIEELVASRIRWTYLTPPDWRDRDARWIQEHKITGTLPPIEKEYFREDGSRVPVLIGAATFEDGGNQGVAFVLDLTSANALRKRCASWSRSAISPRGCAYQRTGSVLTPSSFQANVQRGETINASRATCVQ